MCGHVSPCPLPFGIGQSKAIGAAHSLRWSCVPLNYLPTSPGRKRIERLQRELSKEIRVEIQFIIRSPILVKNKNNSPFNFWASEAEMSMRALKVESRIEFKTQPHLLQVV